jgi:hypothetical protein
MFMVMVHYDDGSSGYLNTDKPIPAISRHSYDATKMDHEVAERWVHWLMKGDGPEYKQHYFLTIEAAE